MRQSCLYSLGNQVLRTRLPIDKARLTLDNSVRSGLLCDSPRVELLDYPARPEFPELVEPKLVPSLKKAINVHKLNPAQFIFLNIAHIELTAIDCYWDTLVRFIDYPELANEGFFEELVDVIRDEARHFTLVEAHLKVLGVEYGAIPAHKSLWENCLSTKSDLGARLAIVPLVQEARGLDAGPKFVHRLKSERDFAGAEIMDLIVKEEENHVRFGMKWFKRVCELEGHTDSVKRFQDLVKAYMPLGLFPPFNYEARLRVGMESSYYTPLHLKSQQ